MKGFFYSDKINNRFLGLKEFRKLYNFITKFLLPRKIESVWLSFSAKIREIRRLAPRISKIYFKRFFTVPEESFSSIAIESYFSPFKIFVSQRASRDFNPGYFL